MRTGHRARAARGHRTSTLPSEAPPNVARRVVRYVCGGRVAALFFLVCASGSFFLSRKTKHGGNTPMKGPFILEGRCARCGQGVSSRHDGTSSQRDGGQLMRQETSLWSCRMLMCVYICLHASLECSRIPVFTVPLPTLYDVPQAIKLTPAWRRSKVICPDLAKS